MLGYWLLMIIGGGVGIFCTFYLLVSMPAVIIWKLYRKVKYHTSMYD